MFSRRQFVASTTASAIVSNSLVQNSLFANQNQGSPYNELVTIREKLEWPGLDLATAAKNLKTAQAAYEFVRDKIVLVDYPGTINGAGGTLRTRAGNSTDKALLLKELLTAMGVTGATLTKAAWPENETPNKGTEQFQSKPASPETKEWHTQAKQEIAQSHQVINDLLTKNNIKLKDAEAKEQKTQDWVWVEASINGKKEVFDPVFPKVNRETVLKQANYNPGQPTITFTVEANTPKGAAKKIIYKKYHADNLIGYDYTLTFAPKDPKYKNSREGIKPASINEWLACLVIGKKRVQSILFRPEGKPSSGKKKSGGGGFGFGLGGLGGGGGSSAETSIEAKSLTLQIDVQNANGEKTTVRRIFQDLQKGFDAYELMGAHQIGIATTGVPADLIYARHADEVIDMISLQAAVKGNDTPIVPSFTRGASSRSSMIANALIVAHLQTNPDGNVSWNGPSIFMESTQLAQRGTKVVRKRRMDVLKQPLTDGVEVSAKSRMLSGLATCTAEAALFKAKSLNQSLLTDRDGLTVSQKVNHHSGKDNILSSVVAEGGHLIQSKKQPDLTWAVKSDGQLLGVYSQSNSPVQAKAVTAEDVTGAFVSGAAGAVAPPAAFLATGLTAYFVELGRAYLVVAEKINILADLISDETPPVGFESDLEALKNMPRDLMYALLRGLARGYIDSVTGTAIGHYTPGGRNPGGFPDKVKDFGIGAGVGSTTWQEDVLDHGESIARDVTR